ncbi:MAG: PEP-CTERM sorting domain-containing protein [Methylococcales bacterium]|nr:PEP-CTERM sorting domain-containing protein [Methylococcales bacterium]
MKLKLLVSSMLMTGALIGSGTASASAITFYNQTLAQFISDSGLGGVFDGDNDAKFTYSSSSADILANATHINVQLIENDLTTKDIYSAIFTFDPTFYQSFGGGYGGSAGFIEYTANAINNSPERFQTVRLDSNVQGQHVGGLDELALKSVYDSSGTLLLPQLVSNAGSPDGPYSFSPQSSIRVIDSLNAKTGVIYNVSNQFTVAVPEPMTLVMLGLGLIGFGYSRRHVLSDVNGMSA